MHREIVNAFTVDFEDWYQGLEVYGLETWNQFPPRIEQNCHRLLEILGRFNVRATFFVLGYLAEKYPKLLRLIHGAGHEIGSHGYSHTQIFRLGPEGFDIEIRRTSDAIEKAIGQAPKGFRAPIFSIVRKSLWALDVLIDNGFLYDSSIFPALNYRYGVAREERFAHHVVAPSGRSIFEIPVASFRLMGVNVPVGGGAYFRIWPYAVTKWSFRQLNRQGRPAVFYFHPWELDPEQPRIPMPKRIALTHYWCLNSAEQKLVSLLTDFKFSTMSDVFHIADGRHGAR